MYPAIDAMRMIVFNKEISTWYTAQPIMEINTNNKRY